MRYIGSKYKLLNFIDDVIKETYGDIGNAVVADLFAGTACVAEMFKENGAAVISNDYLMFSYALQVAKIKLNHIPVCKISYTDALEQLNSLKGREGFFYRNYTSEGTSNGKYSRNYFSMENAKKIDSICLKLNEWRDKKLINEDMYFFICASLIDSITRVSNTSGTYGAFLKIDDQRKYKPLVLEELQCIDNGKINYCYCEDILKLIDNVEGDVLYLDPPYNSRQYPPYYHILETAVLYDEPAIYGITGRRPYQEKISPFCMKDKALPAMLDVVERARFKHIYISYSTDGIIPYKEFSEKLSELGTVNIFYKNYRRYKSNSNGTEASFPEQKLKEIIIYVKKR